MHLKNCIAIFTAVVILALTSAKTNAQMERSGVDSLPVEAELIDMLRRIDQLTTYGPHYKNPNAAGRLVILNRAAPVGVKSLSEVSLKGPAYKNRKVMVTTRSATSIRKRTKRRLSGPRYKNRSAKTYWLY